MAEGEGCVGTTAVACTGAALTTCGEGWTISHPVRETEARAINKRAGLSCMVLTLQVTLLM